ncbi:MAG: hypothetical protein R2736_19530 [Solirubrobacterales bacterium]
MSDSVAVAATVPRFHPPLNSGPPMLDTVGSVGSVIVTVVPYRTAHAECMVAPVTQTVEVS